MSKKHDEAMVIEYDRNGDASELRERRKPLPAPGPGEVVVEVIATGISHIDGFIRSGREADWRETAFPRGSGSDFAGIVVGAGPQTTGFTVGTQVIGHVRSGAHATFIVVPVTALVTKPKNVSWEVAGGLYLAGATALDTLDGLRLGADDVLVISAAAGAVGSIEAQLAKLTERPSSAPAATAISTTCGSSGSHRSSTATASQTASAPPPASPSPASSITSAKTDGPSRRSSASPIAATAPASTAATRSCGCSTTTPTRSPTERINSSASPSWRRTTRSPC
ncbi:alcohol dehydrogenase catalytic domain-containing protein [Leifsonia aquatica]|uniref:alcohol dehydrogenase catalytic domain-containing protein n=1 Tax=Leifsonia aquatica TaxID=144185 RepID=UPI0037F515AC